MSSSAIRRLCQRARYFHGGVKCCRRRLLSTLRFGRSELQHTLDRLKTDMEFALSLGTTDVLIWEGRAPEGTREPEWLENLLPRLIELFRSRHLPSPNPEE